jgi:hypothetical protein
MSNSIIKKGAAVIAIFAALFIFGVRVDHPKSGLGSALGSATTSIAIYRETTSVKVGDKVFSIIVEDKNTSITYMLADLSVIKAVPKVKTLPQFDVSINITKEFSEKFLKAKNGMPEAENFAVVSDAISSEILLNYSTVNTNRIKFSVDATSHNKLSATCFSANIFKEILTANKGAETGIFEVSGQGLARVTFTGKDFNSTYYLVQLSIQ